MQFKVSDMRLVRTDKERVVQGEEQMAYFQFDASWDKSVKTAGFIRDGDVVYHAAIVDGACLVPPSLADVPSFGVVVFRGGMRRTNPVEIAVEPNPLSCASILPPSDLYGDLHKRLLKLEEEKHNQGNKESQHIANSQNPHGVTKEQVGLGHADDTADMDKPLSNAMREALAKKAEKKNFYTVDKMSSVTLNVYPYYERISNVIEIDDTWSSGMSMTFSKSVIYRITHSEHVYIGSMFYPEEGAEFVIHCQNQNGVLLETMSTIYDMTGDTQNRWELKTGEAVVIKCENGVLKIVSGNPTTQIVLSDGINNVIFPKLNGNMDIGNIISHNMDEFETVKNVVQQITSGSVYLEDNAVYSITATDNLTFVLPDGVTLASNRTHEIEVELYSNLEYTINFDAPGDGLLYLNSVPPRMSAGIYRLQFVYDTHYCRWCVTCTEYRDDWSEALGLRADFENSVYERLEAAVGKSKGADFDRYAMYGGRRRCNVADDGTILAYEGEDGYVTDGSNGQVMVYQPAFYYKVIPLVLDGIKIRKAEYYVSEKPLVGFKRHPAFYDANGNEIDYILLSAFEGCVYDADGGEDGTGAYVICEYGNAPDASNSDFSADKLCSIAGTVPFNNLTRSEVAQLAQNRGEGWNIDHILSLSMHQLLMVIEGGTFCTREIYGTGVAYAGKMVPTGDTRSNTYGYKHFTYRGVESVWGNTHKHIDGVGFDGNRVFVVATAYHETIGTTLEQKTMGAVGYNSSFGYNSVADWLFIPAEGNGTSASPIGDQSWQRDADGYILFGMYKSIKSNTGAFGITTEETVGGGRLLFVPTAEMEGEA